VPSKIVPLPDLMQGLSRDERLFGLDVGTKTIGLALSDVMRQIATPFDTIRRTKFTADVAKLLEHCKAQGVGGLVVGLPMNLDGTEGPRAQSTRAFVRNLWAVSDLPVAFWDERLSSAAVNRAMIAADVTRAKRAAAVDAAAAAYMLQAALDASRPPPRGDTDEAEEPPPPTP